jgi:hypothetical protein
MNLRGWIPVRIAWRASAPQVEWMLLGRERLLDPFFHETLQRQMAKPFHQLFRRETGLEEMEAWTEAEPGAPLKGIVYHMSRCGSTLIGQQLAAVEKNIVASEPAPIDDVLQLPLKHPGLSRAEQVRWLRAMAGALGQRRNGEDALYLKADCWHIHHLDLMREAFPDTPWIFLYRDPVEVMVSQTRIPASWTVPAIVHPRRLSMEMSDWDPREMDVYRARALAKICQAGLRAVQQTGGGQLVNYNELPEAMYTRLLTHFGLCDEDLPAMQKAALQDAKSPRARFTKDATQKQAAATERLRAVVAEHLLPVYMQLEAERTARLEPTGTPISA